MKIRVLLAFCALLPGATPLFCQGGPAIPLEPSVQLSVPDVMLVNQAGEHVRFNSGVVKGRVAVITSFFTTCSAICPLTEERLSHLARLLGHRMGKDVVFVSVSIDPENDTPERMRAWAEKFRVGPGWVLVSGKKEEVTALLKSLGLYVDRPQRHQSALIIGNQTSGWARVSSWSAPEKLATVIDRFSAGHPHTGNVSSVSAGKK